MYVLGAEEGRVHTSWGRERGKQRTPAHKGLFSALRAPPPPFHPTSHPPLVLASTRRAALLRNMWHCSRQCSTSHASGRSWPGRTLALCSTGCTVSPGPTLAECSSTSLVRRRSLCLGERPSELQRQAVGCRGRLLFSSFLFRFEDVFLLRCGVFSCGVM